MGEVEDPKDNNALAQMSHEKEKDCDNEKVRKKLERMFEST
jgi:hypothetical protein